MNKRLILCFTVLLSATVALTGCGNRDNQQKLMQSLQDIRNRPSGQVDPLPERPEYQPVFYSGTDQRSPFHLYEKQESSSGRYMPDQFRPDTKRVKGDLEQIPLESLTLVGTLQFADEKYPSALIDDSRGRIHKVTKGQYLGQDFGRVVDISEDTVLIEETVQDEQGGWIKRPRQLTMATQSDE